MNEAEPQSVRTRSTIAVIAAGIFVTGFGWPGIIGRLPFSLFLKNQLGVTAYGVSHFWAVATFAWYVKPIFGFICDAYPLFGTKRRGYMIWGSVLAGTFWLTFAFIPSRYGWMMAVMTGLNVAMVFVSTVVGGLQVEVSQRLGATGRLASMRQALEGVMNLASGPVGGLLAVHAFGWTAVTGSAILFSFVPTAMMFHEPGGARANRGVWTDAAKQLRVIARSRGVWGAAGLLFLVYLAPGFQTPMLFYQTDVLHFDPRFIGLLQLLGGVGLIVGSAGYSWICRRVALRPLLIGGIVISALTTLFYLRYDSAVAAIIIDSSTGLIQAAAVLPLYDLVSRAAPRGHASLSFSLMMSIRNIAIFSISDPLGSYLHDHFHMSFKSLVWLNAGSTLAVLLFLPVLPAALLAGREGTAESAAA